MTRIRYFRTYPTFHNYRLVSSINHQVCDSYENGCAFFIARSDIAKRIIISFRGTKNQKQLFAEAIDSVQPSTNFYDIGNVNAYFYRAMESLWPKVEEILKNPLYQVERIL